MSTIMIRCPHTEAAVSTGIDMDWTAFNRLRDVRSEIICPSCGGTHVWTARDAWLTHGARDPNGAPSPQRARPVAGAVRLRAV
jgi:CO dehydrogenase/acetyl-CoA synthase delta subunit